MGKGGGCFPSKKKFAIDMPEQDPSNPDGVSSNLDQNQLTTTSTTGQLKIFIIFYSMYGHVEILARRMKKGVDSIDGVEGVLYRVPETLPAEVLEQMKVPQKGIEVPVIAVDDLVHADGLLFGFPTRFGSMASQMKAFFDSTFHLWEQQRLAGVPAGFFVDGNHPVSTPWDGLCSHWLHLWHRNVRDGLPKRRLSIWCRSIFR
ncbi:hypothetical protein CICLE_v10029120mg [Citrus x clementina]|uniref:Flavodoxin-like domain-containing protein n=1 Tax=Citrus clementina TaxID=85681 RepID=V4RPV4_CITCL|nr:hypothetical protein CICLE_v10029120mg [Citrus x clementina]